MSLDIPLAGWILSVITFFVGSILPTLYRKLFYEGISVKQLYNLKAFTQNKYQKESGTVTFSTLIKIANVRKESLLLDSIKVPSVSTSGIKFEPFDTSLHFLAPDERLHIPFSDAPDYVPSYFPLIIKSDEEKNIGIEFLFRCIPKDAEMMYEILSNHIAAKGLPIRFRINGKYRDYVLHINRDEA